MAYHCRFDVQPYIGLFNPDKGICVCVSYNVCVQYLGGNEGGRRGDCAMQELFVPEVQKRIMRIGLVSFYRGIDIYNHEKLRGRPSGNTCR